MSPAKALPPAPAPTTAAVRAVMQGNRGSDTRPEVALRSALHRQGLRFKKHSKPLATLRCLADIVFPREQVVVFLDGCFWHSCPMHGHTPRANSEYWVAKLSANSARDRRNGALLTAAGCM